MARVMMGFERTIIEGVAGKRSTLLFCVVGPSASGKSVIVEAIRQRFNNSVLVSVSATTRAPRPAEQSGRHYLFMSADEFNTRVAQNGFLEWEQVHGRCYGTPRESLDRAVREGRDLLLAIDIKGALKVRAQYPAQCIIVVIVPPSLEVLKQRLTHRSPVPPEELERRLATTHEECQLIYGAARDDLDYLVVNEDLAQACAEVGSILVAERRRLDRLEGGYWSEWVEAALTRQREVSSVG